MAYIGYFFLAIFTAVGFVECLHQIWRILHEKKQLNKTIMVFPATGTPQTLEFILREFQYDRQWESKTPDDIYIIDFGLSAEGKQMLALLQKDITGINICTEAELPALLKRNLA